MDFLIFWFWYYLESNRIQIRRLLIHCEPVLEVSVRRLAVDIVGANKHAVTLQQHTSHRAGSDDEAHLYLRELVLLGLELTRDHGLPVAHGLGEVDEVPNRGAGHLNPRHQVRHGGRHTGDRSVWKIRLVSTLSHVTRTIHTKYLLNLSNYWESVPMTQQWIMYVSMYHQVSVYFLQNWHSTWK